MGVLQDVLVSEVIMTKGGEKGEERREEDTYSAHGVLLWELWLT